MTHPWIPLSPCGEGCLPAPASVPGVGAARRAWRLVGLLAGSMAPGGALTQLGYAATRWAPPARRQLGELRSSFEEVTITRTVWRNLPPAVVYLARRPRPQQPRKGSDPRWAD
ncbi:MAG: hypothetical protein ACRDT0_27390 [Pseudonocardiaceae bacterium]